MQGLRFAPGKHRWVSALVALTIACCTYMALSAPLGGDYPGPACSTCDFAGPPIAALASGHVGRFFETQPVMGSFSLLLRVPVVAVARAAGAGQLTQYRLGALVCLLAAAGLAWLLVAGMTPRGTQGLLAIALLGLLLAGPLTEKALAWGHPEELLSGLLCVVAVVAAGRGQIVCAGIALGCAVATKQWALLAVIPALIASPGSARRLLLIAASVAAVFILPMVIADPGRFWHLNVQVGVAEGASGASGVTPANIWFAYARQAGVVLGPDGGATYTIPGALESITHPLIFLLGLGLPLLYWRRAPQRPASDLLLLLALVFLLRCLLDPLTYGYHLLPFFATVAAWEALRRHGLPVITLSSVAVIWALNGISDAATFNRVFLAWTLPVAGYVAFRLFAPRVIERAEPAAALK